MSLKVATRTATPSSARPKSRDDTPLEARRKAEGWIREHFTKLGFEIGAIGLNVVKGPILRFVAQTRETSPRSFSGTLDALRGRVENVQPE